ncbi:MAG: DUF4363 family protein [Clostridia bacterium]|nr:DUF4363 family protein [Clostridia bacterium]
MVKTLTSIFVTIALIFGISYWEITHVKKTFAQFDSALTALYKKAESGEATYEDGSAIRTFWRNKKRTLHVWLPHTSIENVDYQLGEALGYLYERKFDDALPKIEVLIEICKRIPRTYSIRLENIF